MATPLLTEDQAKRAFDMNLIRQDQLDAMFPKTTAELPADEPPQPMQQYEAPAGPAVAPDFIPYEPTVGSRIGEAMGFNPTATMGDLNPFGGSSPSPQRLESAQRQQAAFMAPQDRSPIPTADDPYFLAADQEAERQRQLLTNAALNYPGAAGYDIMRRGIESQGQAMQESSRAQAAEYQKLQDAMENYQKDQSIQDIAQNTRSDAALRDLETMRADLASTKIAPRKLLADKSTGEKILAWTALILGGFSGNGNPAAEALSRAVDRDVAAQKAQYQTKKEGFENKQTLYAQMMDKYKNDRAAREAAKLGIYKMAELKLSELGSRYTDKATQGKVQEQLGKLQLLQDQAKAEFLNSMMGGDDPYKNLDEKQAARLVPGYGFAPDPKMRDLAVTATSMADNTISNINTILSKAQKAGRFDFGANDEISSLVQLLRSENREAILGPGTVQEAERALINDMIKDPGAFFTNRAKAQKALEVIRNAAARTRDNKLKSFGVRPRQGRFRSLEYQ